MAILFGLRGLGKYGLPPQEQLLVAGTAFGGPDDTYRGVMGAYDFQLPKTERFFLSSIGSIGH